MKNKIKKEISMYLPDNIMNAISNYTTDIWDKLCELRFTIDKPVFIDVMGKLEFLKDNGTSVLADRDTIKYIVDKVTNGSMYSVNETIKNGFVTIHGGHRIGFCGTAVYDDSNLKHIKNISSVCIRISREVIGCSVMLAKELYDNGRISDMLIVSPPGCGKTTLIRDICRMLGNGTFGFGHKKVGIADERREISAMCGNIAQNDIGDASFVCDAYKKSTAFKMMLRSMAPEVLVTDEIGDAEDFDAIVLAQKSGVSVIATAHADSMEDLRFKYESKQLRCFEKIVFLKDKGKIYKIFRRINNDY